MLQIILSPAKTMHTLTEGGTPLSQTRLSPETRELYAFLQSRTPAQLKDIWKCSDKLVDENMNRLHTYALDDAGTGALLAYEGIVFQHIAAAVFSDDQWEYVRRHLFILSGLYGALRPDDAVIPYRLEMQARLPGFRKQTLYDFWQDRIARPITDALRSGGSPVLINLASAEYSKAVIPFLPDDVTCISCTFAQQTPGGPKVKATPAKIARGEMVRYMAENNITSPEELKGFSCLGYRYSKELSGENEYTFVL